MGRQPFLKAQAFLGVGNWAAFSSPSGRVAANTYLLRENVSRSKASPAEERRLHCLNTDSISRWSDRFDWNSLHVLSASVGLGHMGCHPTPHEKPRFSRTAFEPNQ